MTNSDKPFRVLIITRDGSDYYELAYATRSEVEDHLQYEDFVLSETEAGEPCNLIAIIDN